MIRHAKENLGVSEDWGKDIQCLTRDRLVIGTMKLVLEAGKRYWSDSWTDEGIMNAAEKAHPASVTPSRRCTFSPSFLAQCPAQGKNAGY